MTDRMTGVRVLHCSDVHITQNYFTAPLRRIGWRRCTALLELRFGNRWTDWAAAPQVLTGIVNDATRHGADHLIVSGDLTGYATPQEFSAVREILGEFAADPQRCTVVPGNHDRYTRGSFRAARFERCFKQLLVSDLPSYTREGPYPFVRLVGESAAVVGLCSSRVGLWPGHSSGAIGRKQLEGLASAIADPAMRGRAVLVAVHHAPLTADGRPDRRGHRLRDAAALFEIVRGPRFAVLHGHIHRRFHHPATHTRPHLFGAGSSTRRGQEGYWLIDIADGEIRGFAHTPPLAQS